MALQELHYKDGPNLGAPEGLAVPVPLVISIELLKPVNSHERAKNISYYEQWNISVVICVTYIP